MHEMALVRNVVDIVIDQADAVNADSVETVYLTIGEARDVVEDLFDGLFAFLARGTVAEHAELVILRTPLMFRCNSCGRAFRLDVHDENTWACPGCHTPKNYRLCSGNEFRVDCIEVRGRAANALAS